MSEETREVAEFVARAQLRDLPDAVAHEGIRAFLNWLGCALGGCRNEIVATFDEALKEYARGDDATVIGRRQRYDIFHTAYINSISGSVNTFDDTHAEAIVHPTGPVASALFSLAEMRGVRGDEMLLALCLGLDVECRLSKAISVPPAQGDIAWSQTGITGGVGAAVAASKLLGLTAEQTVNAIGIAASEAAGFRAVNTTMALHLVQSRPAPSGLRAALIAKGGFACAPDIIEGRYGFAAAFSRVPNLPALTFNLGKHFELLANTYKPYPCGIVINPIIEACLELRSRLAAEKSGLSSVRIVGCPAALSLCDRKKPGSPSEAKVSLYHWAAAALVRGRATLEMGESEALADEAICSLQDRMEASADPTLAIDQARVTIQLMDGRELSHTVEHAVGSAAHPMTDTELETKFVRIGADHPFAGDDKIGLG